MPNSTKVTDCGAMGDASPATRISDRIPVRLPTAETTRTVLEAVPPSARKCFDVITLPWGGEVYAGGALHSVRTKSDANAKGSGLAPETLGADLSWSLHAAMADSSPTTAKSDLRMSLLASDCVHAASSDRATFGTSNQFMCLIVVRINPRTFPLAGLVLRRIAAGERTGSRSQQNSGTHSGVDELLHTILPVD